MGLDVRFVTDLGLPAYYGEWGKSLESDCSSCPTLIRNSFLNCRLFCSTCEVNTYLQSKQAYCQHFLHSAYTSTSIVKTFSVLTALAFLIYIQVNFLNLHQRVYFIVIQQTFSVTILN